MVAFLNGILWDKILLYAIPFIGLFLTLRTRFVQITQLKHSLAGLVGNQANKHRQISPFGALCTALSATMGTGNIVGVATAMTLGGPGALFWMEVAAFFGMAIKYAEGTLAVHFRRQEGQEPWGGPFFYIEDGLGKKWRPLAKCFALFGVVAGTLGIGTLAQGNSVATALQGAVGCQKGSTAYAVTNLATATILVLLVGMVIWGGTVRIAKISAYLVPFMSVVYAGLLLWGLVYAAPKLPQAIACIWQGAFDPSAVMGAASGITLKTAMRVGVGRGVFSNEAGLGSSAIADATAQTNCATQQGLVSMLTVLIDTMVVCTLTGLVVVASGAYQFPRLDGAQITTYALCRLLPLSPAVIAWLLAGCLAIFAFTGIYGWYFYAYQCLRYLCPKASVQRIYPWVFLAMVGASPFVSTTQVWGFSDLCNGLMAIPNLIALTVLSGIVTKQTKEMTKQRKKRRSVKNWF
ncbi:MAG: sodium:alanine symporter family protein [Clostridia bacterium]|nr:sodium:alanine symporter family protein [Clostridia bacterium]